MADAIRDIEVMSTAEDGFDKSIKEIFSSLDEQLSSKKRTEDKYFRAYENLY